MSDSFKAFQAFRITGTAHHTCRAPTKKGHLTTPSIFKLSNWKFTFIFQILASPHKSCFSKCSTFHLNFSPANQVASAISADRSIAWNSTSAMVTASIHQDVAAQHAEMVEIWATCKAKAGGEWAPSGLSDFAIFWYQQDSSWTVHIWQISTRKTTVCSHSPLPGRETSVPTLLRSGTVSLETNSVASYVSFENGLSEVIPPSRPSQWEKIAARPQDSGRAAFWKTN